MPDRYRHTDLIDCTSALFARAGLAQDIAHCVAEVLVEADLLGYDTHGLQFVAAYLAGVESGRTTREGEPGVLAERGALLRVDGRGLPGQWSVRWTLERAYPRAREQGIVIATIQATQNIGCLATYVRRAAQQGFLALLMASAPGNAVVAPHGGREGRMSTNPVALGVPTDGHPVLIDTSSAATSNRQVERRRRSGQRLDIPALVNAAGQPTDDPAALFADPPGAILPGGGVDYGHKGYAMGLMVEAFTSGLAGTGRADLAAGTGSAVGNTVYLQLVDPEALGGLSAMEREASFLAEACRASAPLADGPAVRMPGDRAEAMFTEQLRDGVALHPEILPAMAPLLEKYGIAMPEPITH